MPRLSIELTPEQHKRLKAIAALRGQSIKDYVLQQSLDNIPRAEQKALQQLDALLKPRIEEMESGRSLKPSDALALKRKAAREAARRFRATNLRVFGSALHGNDREGSDLDLLVDPLPGATLFDLGGLQMELEELLGVRVDLLTPGDLPEKLRDKILAEARPV